MDSGFVEIKGNAKEGFTALLIISILGSFLKPIIIGKGKTKRCLKKYDLKEDSIGVYSNNGWSNCGILKIALDQIYLLTKGQKSALLMDKFRAHTDKFIINYAKEKNIQLIFIPEGKTSELQPLDVSINGILKQKGIKMWREESIKVGTNKIHISSAVLCLLKIMKSISSETIKNSFFKSCLLIK